MREAGMLLRAAGLVLREAPRCFRGERVSHWGMGARRLAAAALPLALLLAVTISSQAAEKVTVTVLVIQASPAKGTIDPQLKDIANKLKSAVPCESLKLISRLSKAGSYGETLGFSLPDAMEFQVTPVGERAGTVTVRCVLLRPDPKESGKKKPLLNLTLTGPRGQGLAPIAGPALKDLVLVVSAE
jgi:hypothetical protein